MAQRGHEIQGMVTELIFSNEANGYKVCEVELEDERITVVGILPDVQPGESIAATGAWKQHSTYGEQFEVTSFEKTLPKSKEAIERYLGSGAIKGIGAALAKRIVDKFGEDTLAVMEQEPERLAEIKGISQAGACEIAEQFHQQRQLRETMIFLQRYGITAALAMKIYKQYKESAIHVMQTNPYSLADHIQGIGFRKADQIAQQIGIPLESPHRIRSAVKYILRESSGEGHVFLPLDLLENRVYQLIGVTGIQVENALTELIMEGDVVEKEETGQMRVYLTSFYTAEQGIARRLLSLAEVRQDIAPEEKADRLKQVENAAKITLAPNQQEAVMEALSEGVLVITGGPGTGKTTIINTLLDILEGMDEEVLLAAPTGRAAKRMTEATGREASTIHRLLEIQYMQEEDAKQTFQRNETHPLEADVVILDEVSMVDVLLMNHLLKAIMPGTRLILVGDMDQLPSVGPGNVLKDIIASGCIKVVRLTQIYRQAGLSAIVTNAHRINQGEYPIFNQKDTDFFFMRRRRKEDVARTIVDVILHRMPKFAHCSPIDDIQVLSPMKRGYLGVESLNQILQEALNPPASSKKELEFRQIKLREGDKVMQIRNNYNTPWKVLNRFGYPLDEGEGIFNGDIGRIKTIDPQERCLTVIFDDKKEVEYDYTALEELELAYAVTIHKAQGTESPIIVLPLHSGPAMLFSRNLLYTAVTRARQYVVVIGEEDMVRRMVDNNRPTIRYTALEDRLREEISASALLEGR